MRPGPPTKEDGGPARVPGLIMDSRRKEVWVGRTGLLLGLALAALAVTGWTVPAGNPPAGVRVTLNVAPTGELGVEPTGPVLQAADLHRGQGAEGTFVVGNETGGPLNVRFRVIAPSRDLHALVDVLLTAEGRALVDGRLGEAGSWSPGLDIPAGGRRRVRAEVAVPPDARGYEFRTADLRIELRSEPAG
jgi:hypothetical protein